MNHILTVLVIIGVITVSVGILRFLFEFPHWADSKFYGKRWYMILKKFLNWIFNLLMWIFLILCVLLFIIKVYIDIYMLITK